MAKEAYYFSHDSNAKDDPKIIKLRIKHGWKGYGIFWALIELLRDQDAFKMQTHYDSIAFALREDCETIKSVINDFDLFVIEGDFFYSESLLNRMNLKDSKSKKARDAANKRWKSTKDANAMQTHSERNANAMQGKERKGKESKGNIEYHNDIFRTLWKSEQWIESVCMMFKTSKKEALDHLDKFRLECISKEEFKESERDAKNHFVNWIKKGNPITREGGHDAPIILQMNNRRSQNPQ